MHASARRGSRGGSRALGARGGRPLAAAVAVLGDGAELAVAARARRAWRSRTRRGAAAELVAADLFEDDPLLLVPPPADPGGGRRAAAGGRAGARAPARRAAARRARPPAGRRRRAPAGGADGGRPVGRGDARAAAREAAPGRARRSSPRPYLRRALDELADRGPVSRSCSSWAGRARGRVLERRPDRLRDAWEARRRARDRVSSWSMLAEQTRWAKARRSAARRCARDDRELDLRLRALARGLRADGPVDRRRRARGLLALARTLAGDHAGGARGAGHGGVDHAGRHRRRSTRAPRCSSTAPRPTARAVSATGVVSNLIRAGRLDAAEAIAEQVLAERPRRTGSSSATR